jgi:hypothetical protein
MTTGGSTATAQPSRTAAEAQERAVRTIILLL